MPQIAQTMCPMNCHPTLCGMKVETEDGRLLGIAGDPDNPDSRGFLCMRGNAAREIVGNPKRLLRPQIRDARGGPLREATWDEALDRIAGAMREAGREAVGLWQGHGNAVNDYGVGLKRGQMERFANLYGCQHWNPAMICWGLGGFGLGLVGAVETSTKEDMAANSEMVILWGANTPSQANTTRHIDAAKRRGARIVCIDVRRTETMALADDKIFVRPGSDAALALAMIHQIVADGACDADFVAKHTFGFDELAASVADKTPAWAAERTGLDDETIRDLARDYAATRPAMIVLGGSSIHKGANAWRAARAIACLPALVGDYGVPGGGLGPRHGARSHGAGFKDVTAADRRPPGAYVPNQMEAIVESLETRRVRVLLSLGSNILSSFPGTDRMRAALARTDLVVAYDVFPNQTTREVADIVLPGTIWLEEIGAKSTATHVYLSDRALAPAGEARPLYDLYRDLAVRLDVEDVYPWADQEAALDEVLDHEATGRVTAAEMRRAGGRARLAISEVSYPTRAFHTPSGKIEFFSERARAMGLSATPDAPPDDERGGLVFAHGREWSHFHSFYDHAQALPSLAEKALAPTLWIAPADAAARGVETGDPIAITSREGTFEAVASVTKRMPQGAVWMRDGWPGLNALTDPRAVLPEAALTAFPFSVGQSDFGASVEIEKRAGAEA